MSDIRHNLQSGLPYKPNIVIINGGTNNANIEIDLDKVYGQTEGILTDIWGYAGMADTCIILSTLIPTEDPEGAINQITVNNHFRNLVNKYNGQKCIYVADMQPTGEGANFFPLDGAYWGDSPKVHPNVSLRRTSFRFDPRVMGADSGYRTRDTGGWLTSSTRPSAGPWTLEK